VRCFVAHTLEQSARTITATRRITAESDKR
jgi:hypothetical protein